jgi:trans-2,3-dihydro-3-hydroxyanthranilate isomerase
VNLSYLHYDVFTREPLTGNQLAVFLDGRGVSVDRMQALAREIGFSESTFILPAEAAGTDVRMRIFTPAAEMPMAGHPTIGSTFALAHTGVISPGVSRFIFGLGIGPVPVDLEWHDSGLNFAWMTQLPPTFGPPIEARDAVARAIGLDSSDFVADQPVQNVSCGVSFLLVPVESREAVDRAVPDAAACARLPSTHGGQLPIFLFAMLPPGSPATVHSRMFAPHLGIAEDPATGSASGALGCYLVRHGLIPADAADRIVSAQGVAMNRPSRIHIAIGRRADEIVDVKVGGQAVLVARGEVLLP